jgi:hypothetical protein
LARAGGLDPQTARSLSRGGGLNAYAAAQLPYQVFSGLAVGIGNAFWQSFVGSIPEDLLALNGVSAASAQAQAVLSRFRHPFGYGEGPAAKASEITGEMLLDVGSVYVGATSGLRGLRDTLPLPGTSCKPVGVPLEPRVRFGEGGRVETVFSKIEARNLRGGTGTDEAARELIQKLGAKEEDVAGHIFAKQWGGSGKGADRLVFPFNSGMNGRGNFRTFETYVTSQAKSGNSVFVRARLVYRSPAALRPSGIIYQVRINGKTSVFKFVNP